MTTSSPADPLRYEQALRAVLWRFRPPRLQQGIDLLLRRAEPVHATDEPLPERLAAVYDRVRRRAIDYLVLRRQRSRAATQRDGLRASHTTRVLLDQAIPAAPVRDSADFHCDSGLGGLARWLRAAGYDARFWPHIDDASLLRETSRSNAILLTTDRPLMKRTAITWGLVPALLVPLHQGKQGQFQFVRQRLGLARKTPRCMACGGDLMTVDKTAVRERIPPRTYPWLDEYYECRRCAKLFWPGTHWRNVARELDERT